MRLIQKFALPLFFVIAAAQWYVPISMIAGFEDVLEVGTAYKFKAEPRDPFNPFYGRYMSINYEISSTKRDINEHWEYGTMAYVSVGEDADGFAMITDLTQDEPSTDNYFSAAIISVDRYSELDTVNVVVNLELPFTEFYLNEETAPIAETIFNEGLRDSSDVYGLVKIYKGEAVLEMLYVGDFPITELSRNRLEEMKRENADTVEIEISEEP